MIIEKGSEWQTESYQILDLKCFFVLKNFSDQFVSILNFDFSTTIKYAAITLLAQPHGRNPTFLTMQKIL